MRIENSFVLAVSAFTAQFLSTESYVLRPLRPSPPAGSSSASFREALGARNGIQSLIDYSPTSRNLQLYCSSNDERGDSSWMQQVSKMVKRPLAGVVTAFLLFVVGLRGASARPPRSASNNNSPQKTAVRQNSNGRGTTKTRQVAAKVAKKVEVEIIVNKKQDLNGQLSKIGFVLVGVTTVATLLSGDDKKAKKNTSKKQSVKAAVKAPKRPTPPVTFEEEDEDEDTFVPPPPRSEMFSDRKGSMGISKKVRRGLGNVNALPPPEELFSSDDADSFFSDDKPVKKDGEDIPLPLVPVRKINKFSLPPSKIKAEKVQEKAPVKAMEREYSPVEEEDDFDIPPAKNLPAPAPPAKKSIFDRIFKKGSTTRPTDLRELLRVEDTASAFRTATATVLTAYLTEDSDLFVDVQSGGVLAYDGAEDLSREEQRVSLLKETKEDLLPKEAADAFADVTNAMLVSLTDRCVEMLEKRGRSPEEIEKSTLSALDLLSDFAVSAGNLFGQILPGVVIEDGGIKYNGKAQRGKLETLFASYMKTSMDLGPMKALMAAQGGEEPEADVDPMETEMKAAQVQGRMQCLQHIFSISEGKRSSLEQKAMKDMIMGMVGGDGAGMGDLMGMLGNMSGGAPGAPGGKGGPPMDEAAFDEMIKQAQKEAGGAGGADMDPAQMASMLNESLGEMKAQLKSGNVTAQDIKELESSMGMGLKEMVGMVEMAKKMAGKQKIPEIDEMLSLFKQLLALKK